MTVGYAHTYCATLLGNILEKKKLLCFSIGSTSQFGGVPYHLKYLEMTVILEVL